MNSPFLQVVSIFIAFLGILHCIFWGYKHKNHWYINIPPLVYLVHTLIYNIVLLFEDFNKNLIVEINTWTSVLELHGIITIITYIWIAKQCTKVMGSI